MVCVQAGDITEFIYFGYISCITGPMKQYVRLPTLTVSCNTRADMLKICVK